MMFTKTRHFNFGFINSIDEDGTYHGHFWTPENQEDKIAGVLYLKKEGGLSLKLIGMFAQDSSEILGLHFADHLVILGQFVPGMGSVTLVNCQERERPLR
jgi:hypothetical protein